MKKVILKCGFQAAQIVGLQIKYADATPPVVIPVGSSISVSSASLELVATLDDTSSVPVPPGVSVGITDWYLLDAKGVVSFMPDVTFQSAQTAA